MKHKKRIAVAGAGFSGAVVARELAQAGYDVHVFESRDHVAGNCHTTRDATSGVLVHHYGPHIFHTQHQDIWDYVTQFAEFDRYEHRVKTTATFNGQTAVYSLPINLHTINQFFQKTFSPQEAKAYFETATKASQISGNYQNFEEAALSMLGRDIYECFFKGYTIKQWGCAPQDIPASVLKRLPMRFNYDDRYFEHPFQGIPREGYTALIQNILKHDHIHIYLKTPYDKDMQKEFDHVFFTGPIDAYFDHCEGALPYRTLDFERIDAIGDYQGCPVMNYADQDIPWTRITEHKHFAPSETHAKTIVYKEYSRFAEQSDTPYYPIRSAQSHPVLQAYLNRAAAEHNVTFLGRLGTYSYLDMDQCIMQARQAAKTFLDQKRLCDA